MIDREVYQAEELDCYLETLRAGQVSQHSFNLPETEQNLVEMILGISARACPACIDLGLETVQNLTHKVVLMDDLSSDGLREPSIRRIQPNFHSTRRDHFGLPLAVAGLLARRRRTT